MTPLNFPQNSETAYRDTNVTLGQRHHYTVEALELAGSSIEKGAGDVLYGKVNLNRRLKLSGYLCPVDIGNASIISGLNREVLCSQPAALK